MKTKIVQLAMSLNCCYNLTDMNVLSDQHKFASKGEFNNTSRSLLLNVLLLLHYSYRLIVKQIIDEMCRT
jgi:hypothetical protein